MLTVAPRCHGSVQPPGARMILAQARRALRQGRQERRRCVAGLTQAVCPRNELLIGWAEPFEAYGLMSSWTPALRAALASGLSRVARVAPSRSASSR